jgi:hypothetical protein
MDDVPRQHLCFLQETIVYGRLDIQDFPSDAPKSARFTHDPENLRKYGWAKLPLLSNCRASPTESSQKRFLFCPTCSLWNNHVIARLFEPSSKRIIFETVQNERVIESDAACHDCMRVVSPAAMECFTLPGKSKSTASEISYLCFLLL